MPNAETSDGPTPTPPPPPEPDNVTFKGGDQPKKEGKE
jgi:hypothetical protein